MDSAAFRDCYMLREHALEEMRCKACIHFGTTCALPAYSNAKCINCTRMTALGMAGAPRKCSCRGQSLAR